MAASTVLVTRDHEGKAENGRLTPPEKRRTRLLAEGGLALAGIIWGANFSLIKFALGYMPPFYYLGIRFLLAFLILAVISVKSFRGLSARQWGISCLVGVCLAAGFGLQTVGLTATSPGINGFLTCVYVLLVPLIIGVTRRRWPRPQVGLGILLVLAGIAVLTVSGQLHFGWGEVLTLLGTIFWSLHILALSYATRRVNTRALTAIQLGVVGVLSLAISLVFERPVLNPGLPALATVVYTAVMGGVVAYLLMTWGQRHTSATAAGVLMSLETVFAVIFSILLGYDPLSGRSLLGFALAFAGVAVAQLGPRPRKRADEGGLTPAEGSVGEVPVPVDELLAAEDESLAPEDEDGAHGQQDHSQHA